MKNSISKKELRKFSLLCGFSLLILLYFLIPILNSSLFSKFIIFIIISFIVVTNLKPSFLSLAYKLWIKIGNTLAQINSNILLAIIFIFILIPISFFMKVFGYDPLNLKRKNKKTYRKLKKETFIDLNRIF